MPHSVAASWVSPDANRATNSPFRISGIVGGDQTIQVNQELAAAADYAELDNNGAAHAFQRLGRFTPTGSTLTVRLANSADQFVIADAIRVEQCPNHRPWSFLWDCWQESRYYASAGEAGKSVYIASFNPGRIAAARFPRYRHPARCRRGRRPARRRGARRAGQHCGRGRRASL